MSISTSRNWHLGFSMIEMLVSLVLASLVVIAATAVFVTASSTRGTQDTDTQLQDTGRFVLATVTRIVQQAGYQDYLYNVSGVNSSGSTTGRMLREVQDPNGGTSSGANSDLFDSGRGGGVSDISGADGATASANGSSVVYATSATGVVNASDTLYVRFHGSSTPRDSGTGDGAMVDCLGGAAATPRTVAEFSENNFHVAIPSTAAGEPELRCSRWNGTTWLTQPIGQGVEVFHVAYGVDPNNTGTPVRWVTASTVPSVTNGWKSVRAVRFGFVVRGPIGSGVPGTQTFSPVGAGLGTFNAPNDSRLRRMYSSTVYLRNELLP